MLKLWICRIFGHSYVPFAYSPSEAECQCKRCGRIATVQLQAIAPYRGPKFDGSSYK